MGEIALENDLGILRPTGKSNGVFPTGEGSKIGRKSKLVFRPNPNLRVQPLGPKRWFESRFVFLFPATRRLISDPLFPAGICPVVPTAGCRSVFAPRDRNSREGVRRAAPLVGAGKEHVSKPGAEPSLTLGSAQTSRTKTCQG